MITVYLAETWDDPYLAPTTVDVFADESSARACVQSMQTEGTTPEWSDDEPNARTCKAPYRGGYVLIGRVRTMTVKTQWPA